MTVFHQMPPDCIALTEPLCYFLCEYIKLFILRKLNTLFFICQNVTYLNELFAFLQSVILFMYNSCGSLHCF